MLAGWGVSRGVGIGCAVVFNTDAACDLMAQALGKDAERERLNAAIDYLKSEYSRRADFAIADEKEIFRGYLSILNDVYALSGIGELLERGATAQAAANGAFCAIEEMFSASNDAILRQRAADIRDIKNALLSLLNGKKCFAPEELPAGSVLVTKEIAPSMLCGLSAERTAALVAETGGTLSHSAILARSKGIPAVFGVCGATQLIADGDMLIVDGSYGEVRINPTETALKLYAAKPKTFISPVNNRKTKLKLYATVGSAEDVNRLPKSVDGIGLFRSEFLFTGSKPQTEEEQLAEYSSAAGAAQDKEVIIRTLDVGGDKCAPCFGSTTQRGIAFCLENRDVFKTQLRALLRAAATGNIKIMLPFVSSVDEILLTKELIDSCAAELEAQGLAYRRVPLGIMAETPAAVMLSDVLVRHCDFISIGTNDLSCLIMGKSRDEINTLAPAPPVVAAVKTVIESAKNAGISVGVCGEAVLNPEFSAELERLGADYISLPLNALFVLQ